MPNLMDGRIDRRAVKIFYLHLISWTGRHHCHRQTYHT